MTPSVMSAQSIYPFTSVPNSSGNFVTTLLRSSRQVSSEDACSPLPKSYNAINIEENNDYNARMEPHNILMENRRKERERTQLEIEQNKTFYQRYYQEIHITLCVVLLIIVGFIALYVFSILLGTLIIISNYLFENTMVALFGRAIYNKNFPICSNDIYQGSDCYTRTSTYCT